MLFRSLKKLSSLELSLESTEHEREISDILEEFGKSDGATLEKLVLSVSLDYSLLSGFFRTHKCRGIRVLSILGSDASEEVGVALAENVHDSLVVLWVNATSAEISSDIVVPLLAKCTKLNRLDITIHSRDLARRIGEQSIAPLKEVTLSVLDEIFSDEDLSTLIPAFKQVETLELVDGNIIS